MLVDGWWERRAIMGGGSFWAALPPSCTCCFYLTRSEDGRWRAKGPEQWQENVLLARQGSQLGRAMCPSCTWGGWQAVGGEIEGCHHCPSKVCALVNCLNHLYGCAGSISADCNSFKKTKNYCILLPKLSIESLFQKRWAVLYYMLHFQWLSS